MLARRSFFIGAGAALLSSHPALADTFRLNQRFEPQHVRFRGYARGTIVVEPAEKFLYLVEGGGTATRYRVGVGMAGLGFKGTAVVGRKARWPRWQPTDKMIRLAPWRYKRYADGMPGGPDNPLGSRALYLYRDGKDIYYRIHGTNRPSSIGRAVTAGCIRMLNAHVEQLYDRVRIGTKVVVR